MRTSRCSVRKDPIDGKSNARRGAPMITRTTCRVCDGSLEPVLDLGEHYVSDFILPGDSDGTKAPLELVICRRCRLLQRRHRRQITSSRGAFVPSESPGKMKSET